MHRPRLSLTGTPMACSPGAKRRGAQAELQRTASRPPAWVSWMPAGEQVTAVEPAFNRLTLFDPRLPHGVRAVEGTRDPRRGRLVVTGWFTEPTPFFNGASFQAKDQGRAHALVTRPPHRHKEGTPDGW